MIGLAAAIAFVVTGQTDRLNVAFSVQTLELGTLKVCLYPGFAPFSSKDEKREWVGWDVSYLQNFARHKNLTFEPVEIENFAGIWNLPGEDRCDIAASGISDFPKRREETGDKGLWSDPYYQVIRAMAVRTADRHKLKSIKDLRGKTVIVTSRSTADIDLRNRMEQADIDSVTIKNTADERDAAIKVRDGHGKQAPFAYAGGYGSIELLVEELGGLSLVWPHCLMDARGDRKAEPFSFVARAASTGLLESLNEYAEKPVQYPPVQFPSPKIGTR
ncbi:MAG: transporter substrate-binding domain-containing protein [Longispora sp.]|nr:transporter substrate-binding domain-containing protein [Longispora sp. (in: high G+C Gram-positive bacteria)]